MSRPFSYNDENLTVIGNMLFVRFHNDYEIHPGVPQVTLPPEVVKRLCYTNNYLLTTSPSLSNKPPYTCGYHYF